MAFAPHLRVTALGRLGTASGERFSYGVNMARVDQAPLGPILQPGQQVWTDVATDIRNFHMRATSRICYRAVLEEVKIASIGADGKYTTDPVIVDVTDTPGAIDYAASPDVLKVIPQAACAVSLGTARRGATGRGRFFLPMPVVSLGDNLLMDEAQRDGIQASAATLVEALGDQPGIDVFGLAVVVSSSKGYNSPVTGVRVGRVVDTVRSRRRSLPEQFDPYTATPQTP